MQARLLVLGRLHLLDPDSSLHGIFGRIRLGRDGYVRAQGRDVGDCLPGIPSLQHDTEDLSVDVPGCPSENIQALEHLVHVPALDGRSGVDDLLSVSALDANKRRWVLKETSSIKTGPWLR